MAAVGRAGFYDSRSDEIAIPPRGEIVDGLVLDVEDDLVWRDRRLPQDPPLERAVRVVTSSAKPRPTSI